MLCKRTLNNFIIANFDVSDHTKSVQIIGWNQYNTTVTYDLSQILYIKVDGKIIKPTTHYTFSSNEDKYSSLIIPQLTVLNWTCTSQ